MFKKIVLLTITLLLNSAFAQETITREQRCQTAQQNLERLSDISKPIYGRASDGSVRELNYQEIVNARQENQDLVNSLCSIIVQPSANPQYETRAAVSVAPQSSPEVALRSALLRGDWAEVEVILVYVMMFDDDTAQKIMDFAQRHSTDDTLKYVNEIQNIDEDLDKDKIQDENGTVVVDEEKNVATGKTDNSESSEYDDFYYKEPTETEQKDEKEKKKKSKKGDTKPSGKNKGSDTPTIAKGKTPYEGETLDEFTKRVLDEGYGAGNWSKSGEKKNTNSNKTNKKVGKGEYSKIHKWASRTYFNPRSN